jgi:protein-histidine pros-kinase
MVLRLAPAPEAAVIRSDERFLRQIVLNLASNAIKYGRVAGRPGQVTLSLDSTAAGYEIVVADDGPGLTQQQLARAFQPFERLGQEAGTQTGSGLGLVITRQLAQLLGAEVCLTSEPGHGTRSTVRVPR